LQKEGEEIRSRSSKKKKEVFQPIGGGGERATENWNGTGETVLADGGEGKKLYDLRSLQWRRGRLAGQWGGGKLQEKGSVEQTDKKGRGNEPARRVVQLIFPPEGKRNTQFGERKKKGGCWDRDLTQEGTEN